MRDREENAVPSPPAARLGAFVREQRKAGRMTQEELGELAGVGTRFVSELERGKPTLRLDVVEKVLHVFGRTISHEPAPRELEES